MRSHVPMMLLATTLGCGSGGSDELRRAPSGAEPSTREETTESHVDFSGRLAAAKEIISSNLRDEALSQVAQDAAEAGVVEVAQEALGGMVSMEKRNETAATAALSLAEAGQETEAVAVAKRIIDTDQRNGVLSRIAKGEGE